ncbi:molybdopterin molybdotransferase MoeA [Herbiconiux solani]|uniref:molybdopterin molybdotransferase MoeA n=1 Tax=Herbiconiux solani TaxID=661329 RepID=UPI00082446C0|nr:molybdopterin molybdotransferase MoeA [Herbiconiux solani]
MTRGADATPWREARARAHAAGAASGLDPIEVPLADAAGRILAADVASPGDIPHYASSAMDGWAVAGPPPWRLVADGPRTGSAATVALSSGEACRIATGQIVPPGATAVLRSERASESTSPGPGGHEIDSRPKADAQWVVPGAGADAAEWADGKHIRRAGTEAGDGEVLVSVGARLNPAQLALAAACGLDLLPVLAHPQVALVLTGDEVVTAGTPGPGQVRDSFGPSLPPLLRLLGADPVATRRLGDDPAVTRAVFAEPAAGGGGGDGGTGGHAQADLSAGAEGLGPVGDIDRLPWTSLVVTTGGTGGSDVDHVRRALVDAGAEFVVDRVAVRPGGPASLARLPDGRLVLLLPGNPLAAMIGLLLVGAPAIAGLAGRPLDEPGRIHLAEASPTTRASAFVTPYRLSPDGAVPTVWTGSAMLRGLAEADGLVILESTDGTREDTGAAVDEWPTLPLPWLG